MTFAGATYEAPFDEKRLTKQIGRIYGVMNDQRWRTLREIAEITGDSEASISAQLRNLRKPDFGSFRVEKRSRGDRTMGLYEYLLLPPLPRLLEQTSLLDEAVA